MKLNLYGKCMVIPSCWTKTLSRPWFLGSSRFYKYYGNPQPPRVMAACHGAQTSHHYLWEPTTFIFSGYLTIFDPYSQGQKPSYCHYMSKNPTFLPVFGRNWLSSWVQHIAKTRNENPYGVFLGLCVLQTNPSTCFEKIQVLTIVSKIYWTQFTSNTSIIGPLHLLNNCFSRVWPENWPEKSKPWKPIFRSGLLPSVASFVSKKVEGTLLQPLNLICFRKQFHTETDYYPRNPNSHKLKVL